MRAKNTTELLEEQMGKGLGTSTVFTTAQQTGDFYCVQFVADSTISSIAANNCDGEAALQTDITAGTVLFLNITEITLSSGLAIVYSN